MHEANGLRVLDEYVWAEVSLLTLGCARNLKPQ